MALSKLNFLCSIACLGLLTCSAHASKEELPVLTTKQDIRNIRYVSSDGKYTYYQRTNGSLQFSTNYKVTEVLQKEPNTEFKLKAGAAKKYILVEINSNFHTYLAPKDNQEIYLINYGTAEAKKVAEGRMIGLHVEDKWFSYFNSFNKLLTIQSPLSEKLKHQVKLANNKNPYFIPEVIMTDTDTALYTDINKEGIPGILTFKLNSKKIKLLHKSASSTKRIELCINSENIYIMEYGLDPIDKGTTIYKLSKDNLSMNKAKSIYTSEENDLGSLICELNQEHLYFIKTYRNSTGKLTYDAFKVSTDGKKSEKLSSVNFATNLFLLDQKLLLPYQDKYYIIEGKNNLTEFDKINKGP